MPAHILPGKIAKQDCPALNLKQSSEVNMAHQSKSTRPSPVGASAVFILLLAMHAAHADTSVYKYTGPDGITVYTQTLPENYSPGKVTTIKIKSLPVAQQRAAIRMLDAMENKADAGIKQQHSKLLDADQEINAAIKNLQQAESDLQSSSVPTGADRIGKVGGGTRLKESYFLRVAKLQGAVDQAKLALEQAYRKRNELR
jgi:L-alanine-DL-glutamate epimerase-like enolase superfamily enzyme